MRRETALALLEKASQVSDAVKEIRQVIDSEALQVGDRSMIEHSLSIVATEVEALASTLGGIIKDPTKTE